MNLAGMFAMNPEWILRLLLAALTGAVIGMERQSRSKEAGTGTHALVCIAAASLTLVSKYGFEDTVRFDSARVAAQIISGIGFLGAGIIFVRNEIVQGLTTAAGVFSTAGIGICFGAGLCGVGILTGILVILVQFSLHNLRHGSGLLLFETRICVTTKESVTDITDVMNIIRKYNNNPGRVSVSEKNNQRIVETDLVTSHETKFDDIIQELKQLPTVAEVTLRKK